MMSENIKIYKKTEEGYPKTLLQLPDAPSRLYVLGELPDPMRPAIAIVGARNCSSYGKNMAYEYARILTQRGIQVISGLARGVDAAAHAGALAAGGKTYGVMGCGVDFCYPTSSRKLYHVMQQQGGILSEFAPGTPPLSYHFPLRNRIISGLSGAILVVEAKEKSGSLITADAALEQGRTVFALPGRAGDLLSEGCNRWVYAELGVLYAGGVNIPLSIKLTSDEILFRIEHSGVRFLIVSSYYFRRIREMSSRLLQDHCIRL